MAWTGGVGVDVILDCVGGSYFSDNLSCLALDGVWVLYGLMGGVQVSGPLLGGTINAMELKFKFYEVVYQLNLEQIIR